MYDALLTRWLQWLGGEPCFRIYGKGRAEADWRVVDVFAAARRNSTSRWPVLWQGTCITWTSAVIAVGWDFAAAVVSEQAIEPASRQRPVTVAGGRLRDVQRRQGANARSFATACEVLAHECGHTWQARRIGAAYLPLVGAVTWFGEGAHFWNHFENEASEVGQFGGFVNGSVYPRLIGCLTS
jgi:hypothetical protein